MIEIHKMTQARVLEFALDYLEENIQYGDISSALYKITEEDQEEDPKIMEDESAQVEAAVYLIDDIRNGILADLVTEGS